MTQENDTGLTAKQKSSASSVVSPEKNPYLDERLLEEQLGLRTESENSIKSVSKELFSSDKIDVKTELSGDEINMVTKLRFLEERFALGNMDTLINSLLRLRVSKNRKSRDEFIKALNSENQQEDGQNFFKKMMGVQK